MRRPRASAAPRLWLGRRLFAWLFFGCVVLLLCASALAKPVDHDEHQFVASAWLIAHRGLLPYRDFAYFHLPYLSFIYTAPYLFTNQVLLAARLTSVLAALASALLVYWAAGGKDADGRGLFIGAAAVLIWLLNPITQYATGLAWNHDAALLFSLLAYVLFVRCGPTQRVMFLSGVCLAIAIGIRASFALAAIAFLLIGWITVRRKTVLLSWLGGLAIGLLPVLMFFLIAPAQFVFGNITYAELNTAWRQAHEFERAMTLTSKFVYLATDVIGWSSTLLVVITFGLMLFVGLRQRLPLPYWLAVALSLALFVAAFLPTPTFEQYFYSCVPFVIVSVAIAARALPPPAAIALVGILLLVSVLQGWSVARQVGVLLTPEQWTPSKAHQVGEWIRQRSGDGIVVSLAPIFPLEADLPINPQLATGPFGYRVGTLLSSDERRRQHLFTVGDIGAVLNAQAPRAILLGFEPEELEEPLALYAQSKQFKYERLPNGNNLWLSP